MKTMKTWVDYRLKEIEEKSGYVDYPKYDMDGSPFQMNGTTVEEEDCFATLSNRLGKIIGFRNY